MYAIYTKYRRNKKSMANGFRTDDYDRALIAVNKQTEGWHFQNGVIEKIMIRDLDTGKYVYSIEAR